VLDKERTSSLGLWSLNSFEQNSNVIFLALIKYNQGDAYVIWGHVVFITTIISGNLAESCAHGARGPTPTACNLSRNTYSMSNCFILPAESLFHFMNYST